MRNNNYNEKLHKLVIYSTLLGVLGAVYAIISTSITNRHEVVVENLKYCYLYVSCDSIDKVYFYPSKRRARDYYVKLQDSSITYYPISLKGWSNKYRKIEALKYSKDSLVTKIRYIQYGTGGNKFWEKAWVPSFTLHDTLPKKLEHLDYHKVKQRQIYNHGL